MNFLKKLQTAFLVRIGFNKSESHVQDVAFQLFSRWVYDRKKIKTCDAKGNPLANPVVKHTLFSPDDKLELSIAAIDDLTEAGIWELEEKIGQDEAVLARADLRRNQIIEAGLGIIQYSNHQRHQGMSDWPPRDQRSAQLVIQKRLQAFVEQNNSTVMAPAVTT